MSNEDVLKLLRTITDNSKTTLDLYQAVFEDQKKCYQELIKCKEEMIEQEKIITALVIEIKDLKERVRKLEEKKEDE